MLTACRILGRFGAHQARDILDTGDSAYSMCRLTLSLETEPAGSG